MRFAIALVLVAILFSLAGCAALQRSGTRTGDIEMTMYARSSDGAESLYEIRKNGTLAFGGGMDARLDSPKWTGDMTDDEIARMRQLLEQCNWLRPTPKAMDRPEGDQRLYRIWLTAPGVVKQFSLKGEHPSLQPLRELFERAALRRLEPDLQKLPQPSIREQKPATMPDALPPAP